MLLYHISAQGVARPCASLAGSHKKSTLYMILHGSIGNGLFHRAFKSVVKKSTIQNQAIGSAITKNRMRMNKTVNI
jgi:hypothetical protein